MTARKIVGVFAHPDDESLLAGGTLARYVADGAEAAVFTVRTKRLAVSAHRTQMTGHVLFRLPWPVLARLWSVEHFAREGAASGGPIARDLVPAR